MKLSEAIRQGCAITSPLTDGRYYAAETLGDEKPAACAIGCAYRAITGHFIPDHDGNGDDDPGLYAWRLQRETGAPLWNGTTPLDGYVTDLHSEIVESNDMDLMSREEIADWLEQKGY